MGLSWNGEAHQHRQAMGQGVLQGDSSVMHFGNRHAHGQAHTDTTTQLALIAGVCRHGVVLQSDKGFEGLCFQVCCNAWAVVYHPHCKLILLNVRMQGYG